MATIETQAATAAGIVPTYAAVAAGGDKVRADSEKIEVVAAVGGSITVTIVATQACSQGSLHDRVVVVAANTRRMISLEPQEQFVSLVDALISLTYTGTTAGATIGSFRS